MEDFYIDYANMDDMQRAYIKRPTNKHMVVTGTAGSGKSVIALHKLREVCDKGSYAIIVYTKSLKRYFINGIESMQIERRSNFNEFMPFQHNNIFYYHEWLSWRSSHTYQKVDYLIIDECQDFTSEQLTEMLKFGRVCFLFGDADQTIMDFGEKVTINPQKVADRLGVVVDKLYKNYRLTIETANVIEKVPNPFVDPDVSGYCVRHGEKPTLIKASSFDSQLDKIITIIKNRSLTNVGILLRFNTKSTAQKHTDDEKKSVEYVKDYFESKHITVEYKYNINKDTNMELDFKSSNPKILTWWCAKGLQFKNVFIVDCDFDYISTGETWKDKKTVASAWYVALSRTSEKLFISYTGKLSSRFPEETSNLYDNPMQKSSSIYF